ncbi:MAG: Flp pilus assembly complex ATPase component TadA [Oscillospiraceae bacterium]|nr:Flp pilus assembly complex ATPase component TadA [Oscillospiraceae bacterium]
MNVFNAKLGEILINAGVITKQDLEAALKTQKETGHRLGTQLILSNFITEEQLCRALRDQLHLKYVDLASVRIDPALSLLVPEAMARASNMLPFDKQGGTLKLAVSDPMDYASVHDIEIHTGLTAEIYICEKSRVSEKIHELYTTQKVFDAAKALADSNELASAASAAAAQAANDEEQPIIRFVNNMLEQAVIMKASDIHIEPGPRNMRVRFRVDGKLLDYINTGNEIFPSVCSRLKFIGGMSIAEKRIPQDGRATYNSGTNNIDLRLSTLPGVFGEKIVIRITTSLGFNLNVDALGFSSGNRAVLETLIHKPYGIVLVTGPTGSGKSTTLYAALSEIQRSEINLVTVENPVEMLVPGITQVNINPAQGLTFPAVLRSVLRQDPDVVMIGEIRDRETAEIATSMSITGHLVFSTLHTYDAPSAVVRLMDMGIQPFMVASSVVGVISQRLVRKLCPQCKKAYTASATQKQLLHAEGEKPLTLYRHVGCPHCTGTGFTGRTVLAEVMPITPLLRASINASESSDRLRELACSEGMYSIANDARALVLAGETSFEEAAQLVDFAEE